VAADIHGTIAAIAFAPRDGAMIDRGTYGGTGVSTGLADALAGRRRDILRAVTQIAFTPRQSAFLDGRVCVRACVAAADRIVHARRHFDGSMALPDVFSFKDYRKFLTELIAENRQIRG